MDTFYSTGSQICFTLLGFWWAVVQFRHGEWMSNPRRRRMAYDISLYFLLPGIMCLVALLAGDVKYLWRIAFALASLIGIAETLLNIVSARSELGHLQAIRAGRWAALVLYAMLTLLALRPELTKDLGLVLTPLEVEGILLSLLVFAGVNFAWVLFAEPVQEVTGS